MTANLSEFIQCAFVEKISDSGEYNYRVNIDGCACEMNGNLEVTADGELDALENAWLHIINIRESQYR